MLILAVIFTPLLFTPLAVLHAAEPATQPVWGDQGDGTYRNPILWADFNNLCVFKAGGTFYLTCASHHFMRMPLLTSKDLVNWTHAGRITGLPTRARLLDQLCAAIRK